MLLTSLSYISAGRRRAGGANVEWDVNGVPRTSSAAACFVCWMKIVHPTRTEGKNLVDPLSILSLVSLVSDIAVNVVALATDAWNAVAPLLPH